MAGKKLSTRAAAVLKLNYLFPFDAGMGGRGRDKFMFYAINYVAELRNLRYTTRWLRKGKGGGFRFHSFIQKVGKKFSHVAVKVYLFFFIPASSVRKW